MKMNWEHIWDIMKTFLVFLIAQIAAMISPVKTTIFILFIWWTLAVIVGIRADKKLNNKLFCLKKAWKSFYQMFLYLVIVLVISVTTILQGDKEAGQTGIKWLTYVGAYYNLISVLRNVKDMYPKVNIWKFLYEVATTQVFESLTGYIGGFFKKFKDYEKTDNN